MAQNLFNRRSIVTFTVAMIAATALTIWGTWFVLHTYVMTRPDPPYKQGGLSSDQKQ